MDDFRSTIYHLSCVNGVIHGLDSVVHDGSVSVDEVDFQPQEIGWTDGGLEKLLSDRHITGPLGMPINFRHAALFNDLDDAKNDYLMTPEPDWYTPDQVTVVQHQPFGTVIPRWREKCKPGHDAADARSYEFVLMSVTIILFWQPINLDEVPFPRL